MKNEKPKLAFVFFGMKNTDNCIKKQLEQINKSIVQFSNKVQFEIIDASRLGLNNDKLKREKLGGFSEEFDPQYYDPVAKYREDKRRKITGGQKIATIFIQIRDLKEITEKRPDLEFIFRLRLDVIVSSELINKAINKVLFEEDINSPFKVFKYKAWAQFFHLVEPFYIHDTAFLISSFDLNNLSKEALNSSKYYRLSSLPSSIWGPLFFKENVFLSNLASNFYGDNSKENQLTFSQIKLLPLYWKYVTANFYIDFKPSVIWYPQWSLEKGLGRTWLNINKKQLRFLSLRQIYFMYRFFDNNYFEENLSYKEIYQISQNKDINFLGNIILLRMMYKFFIQRIMILISKIKRLF